MAGVHAQDYFIDNVAFVLSLVPVALLAAVIALSLVDFRKRRFGSNKLKETTPR